MTEQTQQRTSSYTGINVSTLEGNLTKDAELKTVPTAKGDAVILETRMAFNTIAGGGTTKPNYIDVTVWGEKRANGLLPRLKKGTSVVVTGALSLNEGQNGKIFAQITVEKISPRNGNGNGNGAPAPADPEPEGEKPVADGGEEIPF